MSAFQSISKFVPKPPNKKSTTFKDKFFLSASKLKETTLHASVFGPSSTLWDCPVYVF